MSQITSEQLANKVRDNNERSMRRLLITPRKGYNVRSPKRYHSLASNNPVFINHFWGDKSNAGVNYKRPYNKTSSSAKAYMRGLDN